MAIRIGPNIASLVAARRLNNASDALSGVFGRLSSGQRIQGAADDAASLAIADHLKARNATYGQGVRNVGDVISALRLAEGALVELGSIVQRQMELAAQAASGSYSTIQRQALQSEADALNDEYNRITATTEFNGVKLLQSGTTQISAQFGVDSAGGVSLDFGRNLRTSRGDGTYSLTQTLSGSFGSTAQLMGDANGDGRDDLIVGGNFSPIRVFLGQADGTLATSPITSPSAGGGTGYLGHETADFNNDGKIDLLTSDPYNAPNRFALYLGNGDGTFAAGLTFGTATGTEVTAVGDINGDGALDLAVGRGASIDIYLNSGSGSFSSVATSLTYAGAGAALGMTIGDLNADGRGDLFVQHSGGGGSVFMGQSSGQLAFIGTLGVFGAMGQGAATSGDFNRDGLIDVVTTNTDGGAYRVLLGRGDGTFQYGVSGTFPIIGGRYAFGRDIDNDGLLDLTLAGGSAVFFKGNGDGTFQTATTTAQGSNGGVAFGDYNGDGVLDVIGSTFGVDYRLYIGGATDTTAQKEFLLLTAAGARSALDMLQDMQVDIGREVGAVGAHTARAESALRFLSNIRLESEAAYERIVDADIALEAAELIRLSILRESASAILAQANLEPTLALRLLQT